MPMRVLVTGSSGFIGRNLVESLSRDHVVLAPRHAELDLQDGDGRGPLPRGRPGGRGGPLGHQARPPQRPGPVRPGGGEHAHVRQPDAAPGALRPGGAAHLGLVYDPRFYEPKMREEYLGEHIPADEGGYSKYLCARLAEGVPGAVELRPFGVFGPHEDWEIRFISNAICKCLHDLPITLRQDRRFDYVWVDDLTEVIRRALGGELPAGAYNVTPDEAMPLRVLAEKVRRASGKDVEIQVAQPGMGVEYSGSNERLRRALPGLAFTDVDEAIGRLYRWYEARRGQVRREALLSDK